MTRQPIIKVTLTLASGQVIERIWTLADLNKGRCPSPSLLDQADWLEDRSRSWEHPQDPVALSARVPVGREVDAKRLLA